FAVGNVRLNHMPPFPRRAHRGDRCVCALTVHIIHNHSRAFLRKSNRDRSPNPRASSRHQRRSALKLHDRFSSIPWILAETIPPSGNASTRHLRRDLAGVWPPRRNLSFRATRAICFFLLPSGRPIGQHQWHNCRALSPIEHFDVVIIGAGLSGIGAAYRIQTQCPGKRYAILEARSAIGGTWDLFRYPGVRSDSDMFTLGYPFRPWKDAKAIADGPAILKYVRDTAREFGIDKNVRFEHRLLSASWSSESARWLLEVEDMASGKTVQYTCSFLYGCTGYYRYDSGYAPSFP